MQQNKLYIGNFPYSVDEAQLRALFSRTAISPISP